MYEKIMEAMENEMQEMAGAASEVAENFEKMEEAFSWLVAEGADIENTEKAAAYRSALRHALKAMLCMVDC